MVFITEVLGMRCGANANYIIAGYEKVKPLDLRANHAKKNIIIRGEKFQATAKTKKKLAHNWTGRSVGCPSLGKATGSDLSSK